MAVLKPQAEKPKMQVLGKHTLTQPIVIDAVVVSEGVDTQTGLSRRVLRVPHALVIELGGVTYRAGDQRYDSLTFWPPRANADVDELPEIEG